MDADAAFTFAGRPLFFAFEEGRFGWSCEGCPAPCCAEAGALWVSARQAGLVGELGAEHLVSDCSEDTVGISLGAGGCPALLADGRCSFHARGGMRAKPALCALFPFSDLTDAGTFLVVSPNLTFVCPVILDPPPGATSPSHAGILDDLRFFLGDSAAGFGPVKPPAHGATTLERERRGLESARSLRGRGTLLEALADAAGVTAEDLGTREGEALRFLAAEPLPDDPARCRDVLPLLPALRVAHLGLAAEDIDVALLVAWRIARHGLEAGGPRTVRRTANLFAAAAGLAALSARAHRPVRLEGGLKIPEATASEVSLEALLVLRDIQGNPGDATLAELVRRHVRAAGWQRTAVLSALRRAGLVFE